MKYEKLYLKSFKKFTEEFKSKIKHDLENYNSQGRTYEFAQKKIITDIYKKHGELKIESNPINVLIGDFDSRLDEFVAEHQMRVLSTTILDKFKTINIDKEYNYDQFIEELAFINSRSKITNSFRGDIRTSTNFYNQKQIDKINLTITPYDSWTNHTDSNSTEESPSEKEIKPIKSFDIRNKYKSLFKEESNFYSELTDYFINNELTTFQDFYNVFTKPFDEHNSKVHFFCATQTATYLLSQLKFIVKNFSQKNIGESKLFRTKYGRVINAGLLSKSKKDISNENIILINTILEKYIKK
ncbi:hypothetical protein [Winogradskyella sp. PC D3.3]